MTTKTNNAGLCAEIDHERDDLRDDLLAQGHLSSDAEDLADEWRIEALIVSGWTPDQIDVRLNGSAGR